VLIDFGVDAVIPPIGKAQHAWCSTVSWLSDEDPRASRTCALP
jgi:hypothetical protein